MKIREENKYADNENNLNSVSMNGNVLLICTI